MGLSQRNGVVGLRRNKDKKHINTYILQFFGFILPLIIVFNWILPATANDLSQIQQKIKQQQSKIAEQKRKRDGLQSTLKNQEIEMGKVLDDLKKTELSLNEIQQSIKLTEQEIVRLEKQEKAQKEKLKAQLDSAYRSGIQPSIIERLLSDSAKNADRMSVYYAHINEIRITAIQELRQTQIELKKRRDELKKQQQGQQKELQERKEQEKTLKKVKSERENTIRSIDKTLQQAESRLSELRNNELALRNQIVQATNEAERQEKQALVDLEAKTKKQAQRQATEQEKQQIKAGNGLGRGKYAMPVSGQIVNRFGTTQMGEIKWNGIVIGASNGDTVRAIAAGRVLLADWLQGYGQVVVIDHGNGDMSLYGYNQSLSVKKGQRIEAGQAIASVGNSGGQDRSALYFEIRRKGVAVNPLRWVK